MSVEFQDDEQRLKKWLSLLEPSSDEGRQARDAAVAEMREAGPDRLFPLLQRLLTGPDPVTRCIAVQAVLQVDARQGQDLVLPLLNDPAVEVRWYASGCLHDFGDERAVPALVEVLQNDPDPTVRGTAAYALGGIGSPAAIPALFQAMDTDHEYDDLGHSASSSATTALDHILGTHETRIRFPDGLCTMRPGEPDLEKLRGMAEGLYREWSEGGHREKGER